MGFVAKPVAELLPLGRGDARFAPARGPVRIIEWAFARRPPVHQRQAVAQVVDVCGDRVLPRAAVCIRGAQENCAKPTVFPPGSFT